MEIGVDKLIGRHRSVEKKLKESIKWLDSLSEVDKIILGMTENARHKFKPGSLRAKEKFGSGIFLNGYTGRGVVEIFVQTSDAESLKNKIQKRFDTK